MSLSCHYAQDTPLLDRYLFILITIIGLLVKHMLINILTSDRMESIQFNRVSIFSFLMPSTKTLECELLIKVIGLLRALFVHKVIFRGPIRDLSQCL
jgi:hypothetical protein